MAPRYEDAIIRQPGQRWACQGQPPAWAELRGHLISPCEWFHNEQAGFAHERIAGRRGVPYAATGLLVSRHAGPRSYLDAEILITSINGQQSLNTAETIRRHNAMKTAIDQQSMVGVIVEQAAMHASTQMPIPLFPGDNLPRNINCVVLGWFLPLFMWSEKVPVTGTNNFQAGTQWMVKLQKVNLEQRAWWASATHPRPPALKRRNFAIQAAQEICQHCNVASTRIFTEHFVCLNNQCVNGHWRINGQAITPGQPLTYALPFLQERYDVRQAAAPIIGPTPCPLFFQHFPTWWQNTYQAANAQPLTAGNYRVRMQDLLTGFCCPTCQMVNPRDDWVRWRCRNALCAQASGTNTAFSLPGRPPIVTAAQAVAWGPVAGQSSTAAAHAAVSDLTKLPQHPNFTGRQLTAQFDIYSFQFHNECFLDYYVPLPGTNQSVGGADFLYQRIQEMAVDGTLNFRRRSMVGNGITRTTNHFSQNFGVPYLMDVSVDTIPFNQSPPEIQAATTLVNQWTDRVRQPNNQQFNEMYIAAYWAGQAMGYHNDGEVDLDDKVGTWSLGGRGLFRVRINDRYHFGYSARAAAHDGQRRWIRNDPVIQGCLLYNERLALQQQLASGQITQDQWDTQFQALMAGARQANRTQPRDQLVLPTTHGCYILMYGTLMQRYFEHSMEVDGALRFALTYRQIGQRNYADPTRLARNQARVTADDSFTPM